MPDTRVRDDTAPGPHGPVPVRIYGGAEDDASAGPDGDGRPCLVWMHGGAFIAGNLEMPEADWTARELARRARPARCATRAAGSPRA